MASPHAVGVAALIVRHWGLPDFRGAKWLPPVVVEQVLACTATDAACPVPAQYDYTRITPAGAVITASATCEGTKSSNGFYGSGIINAMRAIGH